MAHVPTIIPVTDLRQDAAEVLRRVQQSGEPAFITQRGRAAAVLVDIREYERSENERALLRALARGDKEVKAGKGHDLDDVLAEADALLDADEP